MSRLIEEDTVIEMLRKNMTNDIQDQIITENNINLIHSAPTAYDVEKVVAGLEYQAKLQEYLRQNASARCNDAQANIHRYAEQCYRNKAIEIVRKGGAE